MITKDMRIEEAVKQKPFITELFSDVGIDFCCGGNRPLSEALGEKHIDVNSFIDLLNRQEAPDGGKDIGAAMQLTPWDLIDYILQVHHAPEKRMLEKIDELLQKILFVHYPHHGAALAEIYQVFLKLKGELLAHLAKEEAEVFPQMKAGNYDQAKALQEEHEVAGELLHQLDDLTQHFAPPEDACETYRLAFRKLKELSDDIHEHVFLENFVLFQEHREIP